MNLVSYYLKKTYTTMLERYYKRSYRTIADFRTVLIRDCGVEYVRYREIPGATRIETWEIKAYGKLYFYNYDCKSKILKSMGVR